MCLHLSRKRSHKTYDIIQQGTVGSKRGGQGTKRRRWRGVGRYPGLKRGETLEADRSEGNVIHEALKTHDDFGREACVRALTLSPAFSEVALNQDGSSNRLILSKS